MLSPCAIQFLSIQIVIIYFFPSREFILRYLTISDKNNCDRKPVAIKENIKWVRIERVEFRIITNDKQGMKEEGYFKERDRPRVRESERERQSIWIWIFKFWNSNWLQNKKKNEERAKNVKQKNSCFPFVYRLTNRTLWSKVSIRPKWSRPHDQCLRPPDSTHNSNDCILLAIFRPIWLSTLDQNQPKWLPSSSCFLLLRIGPRHNWARARSIPCVPARARMWAASRCRLGRCQTWREVLEVGG